jgi:hypothetical protein
MMDRGAPWRTLSGDGATALGFLLATRNAWVFITTAGSIATRTEWTATSDTWLCVATGHRRWACDPLRITCVWQLISFQV